MTERPDAFAHTVNEQRRAATPDTSAWVSANAGSGKTRVLTDRVIRLMLGTPDHRGAEPGQILSITFTKAAAAEMSNRLFQRLGEWATAPDGKLRANLIDLAGPDVGGAYPLDAARRLFARALETPGGLKIQTIHAFAESVLGRFPLEAGLSPEFQVMDEAASGEMLERLKRRLLAGAQIAPEVGLALDRLLDSMADGAFDDLLMTAIHQRGTIQNALRRLGGVAATVAAIRARIGLPADATLDHVEAGGCAFGSYDELGLRRVVQSLREDGGKQAIARADMLDAWIASDDDGRRQMLDDYISVFVTGGGTARKNLFPAKAKKADPAGEQVLLDEQVRMLELADRLKAAAIADRTRDLLTVAEVLLHDYAAEKQRLSLLDYDDQIEKTLDLLKSQAAWVHFKLDQGIDHILIDEAQDTSPQQWDIARRLSAEFFAGTTARQGPRTMFAVGDEKQSIYSFQGADPAGFDRMRRHFHDSAAQVDAGFENVKLELSFRSAPEILTAVDTVFAGPLKEGLTASGADISHTAKRAAAQGLVEVWPLEQPVEVEEPDRWKAPLDTEGAVSPRRRLAQRIAAEIRRLIDARIPVRQKDGGDADTRPVSPGDILILVRRREALVEEIARALKDPKINIPVAGADRMVLTGQIAVLDLMVLGDFLLLPQDDLALATVLKSPLYNLTDDDLFAVAHPRDDHQRLWPAFRARANEDARWQAALDELEELLAEVDQITPFAFYSKLLSARGGRRRLHARLGADQLDPLDEFLNAALADERDHPPSMQGFLHRLRQSDAEIKRDMDQGMDAVRIMTVHGAKGLEAPVVFLPDTARPPRGAGGGLMVIDGPDGIDLPVLSAAKARTPDRIAQQTVLGDAARLAEYNRLLYVAMTRAEDRLYVCGYYNSSRAKPSDDGWYRTVETALEPIGVRDPESGILRIGTEAAADSDIEDGGKAPPKLADWISRPPPEEPAPPRPLAPSRTEDEDDTPPAAASPLAAHASGEGRRRGTLIHHLLEILPGIPPAQRAEVGNRSLARRGADLTPEQRGELLAEALALIEAPEMAPAFGPGSRSEAAITGLVGTTVISGQVDRLAVTADSVWIVDYKTNRPPPDRVENVAVAYTRQMALYREVIRQIHPDKRVIAALAWTYETRLMVLPDTLLDGALASLDLGLDAT
ncbi:double-strand break repair helicase AddA [Minwuia sp.]|uniref:double-strand break repair helicase AddA n=1 Tax=Minwuia sp. TaxID=2493630 RepID=UPI003A94C5C2